MICWYNNMMSCCSKKDLLQQQNDWLLQQKSSIKFDLVTATKYFCMWSFGVCPVLWRLASLVSQPTNINFVTNDSCFSSLFSTIIDHVVAMHVVLAASGSSIISLIDHLAHQPSGWSTPWPTVCWVDLFINAPPSETLKKSYCYLTRHYRNFNIYQCSFGWLVVMTKLTTWIFTDNQNVTYRSLWASHHGGLTIQVLSRVPGYLHWGHRSGQRPAEDALRREVLWQDPPSSQDLLAQDHPHCILHG